MPPFIRFILVRFFSIFVTLFVITAVLYGIVTLTPPETRATLFLPEGQDFSRLSEKQYQQLVEKIITRHHLRDPYPLQYIAWISNLVRGDWGWSPIMNDDVLKSLIRRTPVTAELTLSWQLC